MIMTNKELQAAFKRLNKRFFDNRIQLPSTAVQFGDIEDCDGADGIELGDEIFIHNDFKRHPDMAILVLMHEMVHADLRQDGYIGYENDAGHGVRFKGGIDRLYRAGAFDDLL